MIAPTSRVRSDVLCPVVSGGHCSPNDLFPGRADIFGSVSDTNNCAPFARARLLSYVGLCPGVRALAVESHPRPAHGLPAA